MGQAPRRLTPHVSALHFFGAELRHWRDLRQMPLRALGKAVNYSHTLLSQIETADRWPHDELAKALDNQLQTGGVLHRLMPAIAHLREHGAKIPLSPTAGEPGNLGLLWADDPAGTVAAATRLWNADAGQQPVINAVWMPDALAEPLGRWLLDPKDPLTANDGSRRVGRADIEALWAMSAAFADADHRLGGGHARTTMLFYLDQVLTPLLRGAYTEHIGRDLFAAAARLSDLAGFMCFDSARQGLGQRYFIQGLRMAKTSGNDALGAHILTDMAMQAHWLGHADKAVALAEAACQTAKRSGSAGSLARSHAVRARSHALQGDAAASDRAMISAERALDRSHHDTEPHWIRFFDHTQLATESMYVSHDLGRRKRVRAFAEVTAVADDTMQRRHVLAMTTLAASYLPQEPDGANASQADVDQACQLLGRITPVVASLTSARSFDGINRIRRSLDPFRTRPAVQALEVELVSALIGAA